MTGGSQQLRLFRRAMREHGDLARAVEASGIGLAEAKLIVAADAKEPPPAEAFELLGEVPKREAISVMQGDCVEVLAARDGELFDACVTDPPYHLTSIVKRFGAGNAAPVKAGATGAYARASRGFMGQTWDGGDVAFRVETWRAIYDALKPGAHLVAFSGTRTYHRMVCAIEDAGFEIRDQLGWVYGSGFPKSHDMAKAMARTSVSAEQSCEWGGWGTALKPAWEPIVLAQKPLASKTIAGNVLAHGTGAINIDACRVATDEALRVGAGVIPVCHDPAVPRGRAGEASAGQRYSERGSTDFAATPGPRGGDEKGRWPANILHDGSDDVVSAFPDAPGQQGVVTGNEPTANGFSGDVMYGGMIGRRASAAPRGDAGTAARFFYSAKAGPLDRLGSEHPTVKPVDLMRWLCRLITPPSGTILDPFAGSGTTGIAAMAEGFGAELIDLEVKHVADIERKLAALRGEGGRVLEEHVKRRSERAKDDPLPLFAA